MPHPENTSEIRKQFPDENHTHKNWKMEDFKLIAGVLCLSCCWYPTIDQKWKQSVLKRARSQWKHFLSASVDLQRLLVALFWLPCSLAPPSFQLTKHGWGLLTAVRRAWRLHQRRSALKLGAREKMLVLPFSSLTLKPIVWHSLSP